MTPTARNSAGQTTHVALLRGINVGGRNRVAMADLREVVASLGHRDVSTYIQSGNVLFAAQKGSTTAIAAKLEGAIEARLGVRPLVMVLTREEVAEVVVSNPFPDETNGRLLHAMFRAEAFASDEVRSITDALVEARQRGSAEDLRIVRRTLYLHSPSGISGSQLAAWLTRPAAKTTARNWTTMTKLAQLVGLS